jgi:hypothetical protein
LAPSAGAGSRSNQERRENLDGGIGDENNVLGLSLGHPRTNDHRAKREDGADHSMHAKKRQLSHPSSPRRMTATITAISAKRERPPLVGELPFVIVFYRRMPSQIVAAIQSLICEALAAH